MSFKSPERLSATVALSTHVIQLADYNDFSYDIISEVIKLFVHAHYDDCRFSFLPGIKVIFYYNFAQLFEFLYFLT